MTKQHFERAALLVYKSHVGSTDFVTLGNATAMAEMFAQLFTEFNPRFNRARFMAACGLQVQ